ncbi:hypothetical protein D9M72_416290 [compost metagenome]
MSFLPPEAGGSPKKRQNVKKRKLWIRLQRPGPAAARQNGLPTDKCFTLFPDLRLERPAFKRNHVKAERCSRNKVLERP